MTKEQESERWRNGMQVDDEECERLYTQAQEPAQSTDRPKDQSSRRAQIISAIVILAGVIVVAWMFWDAASR